MERQYLIEIYRDKINAFSNNKLNTSNTKSQKSFEHLTQTSSNQIAQTLQTQNSTISIFNQTQPLVRSNYLLNNNNNINIQHYDLVQQVHKPEIGGGEGKVMLQKKLDIIKQIDKQNDRILENTKQFKQSNSHLLHLKIRNHRSVSFPAIMAKKVIINSQQVSTEKKKINLIKDQSQLQLITQMMVLSRSTSQRSVNRKSRESTFEQLNNEKQTQKRTMSLLISNFSNKNHMESRNLLKDTIELNYSLLFKCIDELINIENITLQSFLDGLIELALYLGENQDYHKAAHLLNQARKISDMNLELFPQKKQLYYHLGSFALLLEKYQFALTLFQKSLQYCWYFSDRDLQISLSEQLSICYYYLSNEEKSYLYFIKYVKKSFSDSNTSYQVTLSRNLVNFYIADIKEDFMHKYSFLALSMLNLPLNIEKCSAYNDQKNPIQYNKQDIDIKRMIRMKSFFYADAETIFQTILNSKEFELIHFYQDDGLVGSNQEKQFLKDFAIFVQKLEEQQTAGLGPRDQNRDQYLIDYRKETMEDQMLRCNQNLRRMYDKEDQIKSKIVLTHKSVQRHKSSFITGQFLIPEKNLRNVDQITQQYLNDPFIK